MKNNIQRICILALTAPFFTACLDDCISYSCAPDSEEVVIPIDPSVPSDERSTPSDEEKTCTSKCLDNSEQRICEVIYGTSHRTSVKTVTCQYGCDTKTGKCKENEVAGQYTCTSECMDENSLRKCIDGKLETITCKYGCDAKTAHCISESKPPQYVTLNGAPHFCPNGLGLKTTGTTSGYFLHTVYTGCRCDSSYKTRCDTQEGDIVLFRCYNNEEQYTTCNSTCSNGASKCW